MKRLLAASACLLACSAFADTKAFEGPSVGLFGEFRSTTVKYKESTVEFSGVGRQAIGASLFADYGWAIGSDKVVLVGAAVNLGPTKLLDYKSSTKSANMSEDTHYSVFAAPGIVLHDKTLAYGKLGYDRSKLSAEASIATGKATEKINGFEYGAGIRTQLTDTLFLNVEAGRISYRAKDVDSSSASTGTTYGRVGLSYKF